MWRWSPQPNSTTQAFDLLGKLSGGKGDSFSWSLFGFRETDSKTTSKTYVIRLQNTSVIVSNHTPLELDVDGTSLFFSKLRLLKGDFEYKIQGL